MFVCERFNRLLVGVSGTNRREPFVDVDTNADSVFDLDVPIAEHPTLATMKNRPSLHGDVIPRVRPILATIIRLDVVK